MTLDPADVVAKAAAWVWVPPDATVVRAEEFWLVAYPAHFSEPTMAVNLATEGSPNALVAKVLDAARELGRDSVAFAGITDATRPTTLEPHLVEAGELCERLAVLARTLEELPDLAVPPGVELRQVLDLDTLRDMDGVSSTVFGGASRSDDELAATVARVVSEVDDPRWVAYRDGRPVGSAGMAVVGAVARLWGGSVVAEARHSGVYRALLDRRLRVAREHGCRMALVKGRVETSAPVLRRAGFSSYGEERVYRVARPAPLI